MDTRESYFRKTIKSAATFFSRWVGANAEMWELTAHHKSLRLLVQSTDRSGNLLVCCIDPISVRGPVRWPGCQLTAATARLPGSEEIGFCVRDQAAGMEIYCGGLEIKENVKL